MMAGGRENHDADDDTDDMDSLPPKFRDGYDGEMMGDPNEQIVQECCPRLNRDLLVNKFWYFFFFGANGSLMPYLILYFKQLGLTPSQVGIVSGLKPFISFVCSPIWGYIADKSNKTKFIYLISIFAYGAGYVAYSFAPSKHICSLMTNTTKNHEHGMMAHIHRRNMITDSTINGWDARNDDTSPERSAVVDSSSSRDKNLQKDNSIDSQSNIAANHELTKRDLLGLDHYFRRKLLPDRMKRLPMYTNIRNKSLPHRTIDTRKFTLPHLMYPAENEYSLFQVPAAMQILTLAEEKTPNDTATIEPGQTHTGKIRGSVTGKESWVGAVRHHKSPWSVCAAAKANAIDSVSLSAAKEKPENLASIFSYLLIITLIATIFSCPLITIVDTATIRKLKETCETHLYGKQRLWGSFAWGIFSFSIGAVLSLLPLCGSKHNEVNYFPAFYIFAGLLTVAMVIGLRLKFHDGSSSVGDDPIEGAAQPASSRTQKIIEGLKLLRDPIYGYFIFTSFFIGMTMSIIKTFLFWHLKDLGAPQILFSIIAAVNCVAEVFVYYFSSLFIKRVGHIKVLYIALICYSLRLFYYGLLKKPWYVLAAEPLSGITTAAAWATMTSFVGMNANPESVTTMQGILHGVHWGLGHGCGELLGGFMVSWVGAAMTFNLFGIASILQLLLFMLVNSFAVKKCGSDELGPEEEDNTEPNNE